MDVYGEKKISENLGRHGASHVYTIRNSAVWLQGLGTALKNLQ